MSTFLGQARARALRPVAALPRPRLTIVPRVAARAPRVPFVLLVVTILISGLVGLLLLNTALQRGAFVSTDLRQQSADLTIQQQRLELELADLSASQRVAQEAQKLGMVGNDSPAFLSLATGSVIGKPIAGEAGKKVDIRSTTTSSQRVRTPKVATVLAGAGVSLTTGPVEVKKPKSDRKGGRDQAEGVDE